MDKSHIRTEQLTLYHKATLALPFQLRMSMARKIKLKMVVLSNTETGDTENDDTDYTENG